MTRISEAHSIARIAALAALAACVACAGAPPSSPATSPGPGDIGAAAPLAVFPSVQAAALDALATAHRTATPLDQRRLRVGTIHRVAHGYTYSAPQRAGKASPHPRQKLRHRLHPVDVASYVIPPRASDWPSTRPSKRPDREMQRIVDELDRAHRPIYMLTETLDVVSYSHGARARVVTRLSARE